MAEMTRKQMVDIINRGESVMIGPQHARRIVTSVADLPSEADMAIGDESREQEELDRLGREIGRMEAERTKIHAARRNRVQAKRDEAERLAKRKEDAAAQQKEDAARREADRARTGRTAEDAGGQNAPAGGGEGGAADQGGLRPSSPVVTGGTLETTNDAGQPIGDEPANEADEGGDDAGDEDDADEAGTEPGTEPAGEDRPRRGKRRRGR